MIQDSATVLGSAYQGVCWGVLFLLAIMLFACLIRAIKGPRIADRIVAINMMGTMVMVIIAILAFLLGEGYLVDICLIYAMVSFLAVIVLTKIYMGVYEEKRREIEQRHEKERESEEGRETGKGGERDGNA